MKQKIQNKYLKPKRGIVLMVVLSAIAFLVVVVQQMGFDSHLEFQNGVSQYHSLKAYHSAQSGLKLALLKVLIYKQIHLSAKESNKDLSLIEPQLNLIWQIPVQWPQELENEEDPKPDESLFDRHTSYQSFTTAEGAKLDINELGSPISFVREWTKEMFFNLLINLRNQHSWLSEKYSENELKQIADETALLFNPASLSSVTYYPSKTALMDINDLIFVSGITEELLEFLKPYITLFGEGGIHLQFADKMILKSLHKNINDQMIEDISPALEEKQNLWTHTNSREFFTEQGLDFLLDHYFTSNFDELSLAELVFNFDTPQNFKITSFGASHGVSRGIEAIIYDPSVIWRSSKLLNLQKDKKYRPDVTNKKQSSSLPELHVSPFIIHWKDIN